jgi:hypothetical protein
MSEHNPATTSEFSSVRSEPVEQGERSAQVLVGQAREQAAQAGEYVARSVQEYPLSALLVAGLVGCGIGYLIHASWFGEPRKRPSAPKGHSGVRRRPRE